MAPDSEDVMLTTNEAAAFIGCSPGRVLQMLRRRELPGLRIGRSWRIPKKALMEALAAIAKRHWMLPEGIEVSIVERPVLVMTGK